MKTFTDERSKDFQLRRKAGNCRAPSNHRTRYTRHHVTSRPRRISSTTRRDTKRQTLEAVLSEGVLAHSWSCDNLRGIATRDLARKKQPAHRRVPTPFRSGPKQCTSSCCGISESIYRIKVRPIHVCLALRIDVDVNPIVKE